LSKIAKLSPLPVSGIQEKLPSSYRDRLFDEFVEFRHGDANGVTLNMSIAEPDGKDGVHFALTWSGPHEYPKKILARFDPSNVDALFVLEDGHAPLAGGAAQWALPFADEAFDWVYCEALIEHAGSYARQYLLLKELARVARKGIFVTTPNRRHPVEFYTGLPFLHWLPASLWKRTLKWLGKDEWGCGCVPHLLDAKTLEKFAMKLPHHSEYTIGHIRKFGLKAYFFLQFRKAASTPSS
jgi:hypothetical protein